MADLITPEQFEVRTGQTMTAQVGAIITDASAFVVDIVNVDAVTSTWDPAAVPSTVPGTVIPVVVAMVRRGLDNPHGFTGESIGDYSYTGASGVGLHATRAEARTLRKAAGRGRAGALNLDSYLPSSPRGVS